MIPLELSQRWMPQTVASTHSQALCTAMPEKVDNKVPLLPQRVFPRCSQSKKIAPLDLSCTDVDADKAADQSLGLPAHLMRASSYFSTAGFASRLHHYRADSLITVRVAVLNGVVPQTATSTLSKAFCTQLEETERKVSHLPQRLSTPAVLPESTREKESHPTIL